MNAAWKSCLPLFLSLAGVFSPPIRILGNRVAELEKKLKTLEMSGLWSLPGGYKYRDQFKRKYTYIYIIFLHKINLIILLYLSASGYLEA